MPSPKTKFAGNPAGVVANADGLSDKQMQSIARELNNSETAFILSPNSDDGAEEHDIWVRFFTPTTEVPICGHATVSAHYIYAMENSLPSCIVKAEGITESDRDQRCPIQVASTGHSKVMIGIKDKDKLDALTPDMTHGRMFAPAIGINEDPVTGNANGPLGAYLVKHKLLKVAANGSDQVSFKGVQGEAMGRPGIVNIVVDSKDGQPVKVQIGGDAVINYATLGILGIGHLATYTVTGLRHSGDNRRIILSPRNAEQAALVANQFNCEVADTNQSVIDQSDLILLAVRPFQLDDLLTELTFPKDKIVISAAAGVTLEQLRDKADLPSKTALILPLVASENAQGFIPVYPDIKEVKALVDSLGKPIIFEEESQFEDASAMAVLKWLDVPLF
ncbi:putative isomerase [Nymphon striatum]|nr:putative isomerase [Nymphon striatum]